MQLILGISQGEPSDTLNMMKNLGLEFEVISSQTDYENAHTEVTIDIEISAEAFIEKLETIVKEQPYELEMLGSVFDTEAQEGIFEQ
jgi:hypothetical protein